VPVLRKACQRPRCTLLLKGVLKNGQTHVCIQVIEPHSCILIRSVINNLLNQTSCCLLAHDCHLLHVPALDTRTIVSVQPRWHLQGLYTHSCGNHLHPLPTCQSKRRPTPALGSRLRKSLTAAVTITLSRISYFVSRAIAYCGCSY
jgi:hypothetical protein